MNRSCRSHTMAFTLLSAAALSACAFLPAHPSASLSGDNRQQTKQEQLRHQDLAAIRAAERSHHPMLAIQLCKQYLNNNPADADTRTTLARLYSQVGRTDQAEQALAPLIASKVPAVLRERARIALDQGHAEPAQKLLEAALLEAPKLPEAEKLLGMALVLQDKHQQAQRHYRAALALGDDDETRYNLGYSLLASDQSGSAVQVLEPLLARSKQPAVHALMASALLRSGDTVRARALAQKWMSPARLDAWLAGANAS